MDWFKCLFCLDQLKDTNLVCAASCNHVVHEWCVETMKSMDDRLCKLCQKNTIVHSVFKEFDLERAVQVAGVPMMIQKLDDIIGLMWEDKKNVSKLFSFSILTENAATQKRASCKKASTKFQKNSNDSRLNIARWSLKTASVKNVWKCSKRQKTKLTIELKIYHFLLTKTFTFNNKNFLVSLILQPIINQLIPEIHRRL